MKLNDPIILDNGLLVATTIHRENMELFAVMFLSNEGEQTILRTAMNERIIFTMLYEEYYKIRKEQRDGQHPTRS